MASKASEKDLDALHGALAGYFLKLLGGQIPELVERTSVSKDEAGVEHTQKSWVETGFMVRPSAGELAVMAKFLKDNAITGAAIEGSQLSDLEKALEDKRRKRGSLPNARDVADAMREMGKELLN